MVADELRDEVTPDARHRRLVILARQSVGDEGQVFLQVLGAKGDAQKAHFSLGDVELVEPADDFNTRFPEKPPIFSMLRHIL